MGNLLAPFLFMIPTALYLDKETSHKVSSLLPAKKKKVARLFCGMDIREHYT
jgi:hypothetical protein